MRTTGLACVAVICSAQVALADLCNCQRDCEGRENPRAGLSFEDEKHRLWYEVRFWSGQCKGEIWLTCWSGPSWYDVMDKVLSNGAPADRPEICERMFTLGVRLGHEWARDNAIRSIHTGDLEAWRGELLESDEPLKAIDKLEMLVDARLK